MEQRSNHPRMAKIHLFIPLFALIHAAIPYPTVAARVAPLPVPTNNNQEQTLSSIFDTSKYGMLQLNNGLAQTPQMGWNSWNFFACDINETVIKETVSGKKGVLIAGAVLMVVLIYPQLKTIAIFESFVSSNADDCWSTLRRDSKGQLVPDPETFPSGIRALADYVHGKGLKLGPSRVKFDPDLFSMKTTTQRSSLLGYPPMRDALNATGRSIFYSLCEWGVDDPALWAGKVGNSWRTTDDINDTWARWLGVVWDTAWCDLDTSEYAANVDGSKSGYPDMLEVGNGGMTHPEYRAHFSIWALMKAPLLIGCDVRNMTAETYNILTNEEVIGINLEFKEGKFMLRGMAAVWAGPLSGVRLAVALWNRCSKAKTITAAWGAIGLELSTSVSVRDLWKHQDVSEDAVASFSAEVDAHGCEMFIFTPKNVSRSDI
ncbi:hypothetical protein RJ639_019983 [Escallonia herrerae]|uniref:Alpha-galactosidase n=1 Tax=Escallonia herrerae TaxID=1293975 RepID=A0AA88V808_9ASTE|nr:hypothetical protein RJ639_019983 [Escallonia herrerae]